jgi:ribosomal protein L37AE/L43A
MSTLRAHKTGGYSDDGAIKIARKTYRCEVCGEYIFKGMPYEKVYGCPVHQGASVLLKGLDCNPFFQRSDSVVTNPECPKCGDELRGYFDVEGYPFWACPSCEWQSAPQRSGDSK